MRTKFNGQIIEPDYVHIIPVDIANLDKDVHIFTLDGYQYFKTLFQMKR